MQCPPRQGSRHAALQHAKQHAATPPAPLRSLPPQLWRLAAGLGRTLVVPNPPCDSTWLGVFSNGHDPHYGFEPDRPEDKDIHVWPDVYDGMAVSGPPASCSGAQRRETPKTIAAPGTCRCLPDAGAGAEAAQCGCRLCLAPAAPSLARPPAPQPPIRNYVS